MIDAHDEMTRAILDTAEKFTDRELAAKGEAHDAYPYADFAWDALKGAVDAGLLSITAPEELGGVSLPCETWALVLEKIACTDAGFAASLLAHAMAVQALLSGADETRAQFIRTKAPSLLGYPLYLQADDLQGVPRAAWKDDHYVLSGKAVRVANAPAADAVVIAAELDDHEPTLFLLPLGEETRPEPVEMLGLRSCPAGHIDLAEVRIPANHLLMRGEKAIAALHGRFYPAVSAILIAILKGSLDYAVQYGLDRYQGGRMIHEHSQLRAMYGLMAVEYKTLYASWLHSLQCDPDPETRLAVKILSGDLAIRAATDGVQLLGGYGYTREYPQERRMRDARQAAELLGSPARMKLSLAEGTINAAGHR